jgi:spore maturation protein CgeB
VEKFLAPGEEVLVARDGADVAAQLDALDAERAAAIGRAARRRMLAEHTFAHRAAQFEDALAACARDRGSFSGFLLARSQ